VTRWPVAATIVLAAALPAAAGLPKALGDFKAGRYLEAVAELQQIVDRSPGNASAYYLLGHCLLKMQRPDDARAEFQRAIELDPSRPEYFQGLALALKTSADWERAIQTASDGLARAVHPETRYALLTLRGYAYGAVNRWTDAVRDLEAAQRLRSEPWLSLLLGKAYFALGAYERAIPPFRDVLIAVPDEPDVLQLLAESHLVLAGAEPDPARKRVLYADALGYARRFAAARPADVDAIHLVGRAALGAGELLQAEGLFLTVLNREPRQCYAMVNLGRTYLALQRWSESEKFLLKATACAPRMAVVFETLGDLYMRRGLPQQAVDAYARAESLEPEPLPPTIPVRNPR
jgi:tetratricopeptide (TPR) repeat protein